MPAETTNSPSSPPFVDIRPFMATFPTGVGVITALGTDGSPWGMTCTSICSVTLEPPTLLVSLRQESPTLDAVLTSGAFALNLLQHNASPIAKLFSSGLQDRFSRVAWRMHHSARGPHLWEAAHSIADCQVVRAETVGDHVVVFGEVCQVTEQGRALPLLYGLRCYAAWPGDESHEQSVGGQQAEL